MTSSSFFGRLAFFLLCWKICLPPLEKKVRIFPLNPEDDTCFTQPCPDPASPEWRRLQDQCCPWGGSFHCQTDDLGNSKRLCMEPVVCPAGYLADFMTTVEERLTVESLCQECPLGEFQPSPTLTHHFTWNHCDKTHTQCPMPGSLPFHLANASSDYLCKCSILQGYRPVPMGDHDCRVFTPSSGCVCKHDPCPDGQILNSTDYECIQLTKAVFETVKKEYLENQVLLQGNMKILRQTLEHLEHKKKEFQKVALLYEQIQRLSSDHKDLCVSILIPLGGFICVDDEKDSPPPVWMPTFIPSSTPVFPAGNFALESDKDNSVHIPFYSVAPVAVFTVIFAFLVAIIQPLVCTEKSQSETHVYIRVLMTTRKEMAVARKEIKNILPFLQRHYGCSVASVSLKERHITVFVRQSKGLTPFPVHALVRDILSPLSIKNLKNSANGVDRPLKVLVLTGTTTDRQDINQTFSIASFPDNMASNTGEIILRLPEEKVEKAVFRELQKTRQDLEGILVKDRLFLEDIREGSIHFHFRLTSPRESLDELAHNRRIIRIAQDFFSHESFRNLAGRHKVTAHFFCNLNVEKVSVLTAKTMYVQIGKHNKVKVAAAPAPPADDTKDEQQPDESYLIYADDSIDVTAAVRSVVSFNASPPRHKHQQGPDNGGPDTSLKPNQIRIVVKCTDDRLASSLHAEWSNVLPLVLNHHPGWNMTRYARRIVWDQRASRSIQRDQLYSFLVDLFSIERVSHLLQDHFPRVNVYAGEAVEKALNAPPEEGRQVQPRRTCLELLRTKINDCCLQVMNFCCGLAMKLCYWILLVIIVLMLIIWIFNFVSDNLRL